MLQTIADYWKRVVNLDDPRIEQYSSLLRFLDDSDAEKAVPIANTMRTALLLVLRQCMHDKAVAWHAFVDLEDSYVRLREYCPVSSDWVDSELSLWDWNVDPEDFGFAFSERRDGRQQQAECQSTLPGASASQENTSETEPCIRYGWVEMYPFPLSIYEAAVQEIRRWGKMRRRAASGTLLIRYDSAMIEAHVTFVSKTDVRIYFTHERPPIRPKTREQYDECRLPFGAPD